MSKLLRCVAAKSVPPSAVADLTFIVNKKLTFIEKIFLTFIEKSHRWKAAFMELSNLL